MTSAGGRFRPAPSAVAGRGRRITQTSAGNSNHHILFSLVFVQVMFEKQLTNSDKIHISIIVKVFCPSYDREAFDNLRQNTLINNRGLNLAFRVIIHTSRVIKRPCPDYLRSSSEPIPSLYRARSPSLRGGTAPGPLCTSRAPSPSCTKARWNMLSNFFFHFPFPFLQKA